MSPREGLRAERVECDGEQRRDGVRASHGCECAASGSAGDVTRGDGRMQDCGEEGAEGLVVEGEEVAEAMLEDGGAGLEGGDAGGLGEAVPGTGVEAVVAAVDAVAEGAPELEGDGAFAFDGEVGEAIGTYDPVKKILKKIAY